MSTIRISTAAALGIVAHRAVFIRGEWHREAPQLLVAALLMPLALLGVEKLREGGARTTYAAAIAAAMTTAAFFAGLYCSIAVYRLLFHPLRDWRGPMLARTSKVWHFWRVWNRQNHVLMDEMRQKYGDFVRIGPNEVAVFKAEALHALDGPGSKFTRSPFYDFLLPDVSVETSRDVKEHDWRRRLWTRALTDRNLDVYYQRILKHVDVLEELVAAEADADRPVDVRELFMHFCFDCIGDLVFSESFNTQTSSEHRNAIALLRGATKLIGRLTPLPWLHRIFNAVQIDLFNDNRRWGTAKIQARIKRGDETQDWATYAIKEAFQAGEDAGQLDHLHGDTQAIMASGSDTIAGTLTCAFYRLALHADEQSKLRIKTASLDTVDRTALAADPALQAFFNETLRLHPVVLTGGLRVTPPEGQVIAGQYIPGGVTLCVPRYSLARDETNFERPVDFVPDRWTEQGDMVKDRRAHLPFGQGRYLCLGQRIAYMEMHAIMVRLLKKYQVTFAPGEDGRSLEAQTRDQFASLPGKVMLRFERR